VRARGKKKDGGGADFGEFWQFLKENGPIFSIARRGEFLGRVRE